MFVSAFMVDSGCGRSARHDERGFFVEGARALAAGAIGQAFDGELDAVLGEKSDHPGLKPLFADVVAEEEAWFEKHKVVPINHMVVVSRTLSEQHPDVVREVHRMLAESAAASSAAPRFDRGEMQRSLKLIIGYSAQQKLIPRAFSVDELFDDVTRALR